MRECRVIRKKSERNKRLAEKIQNIWNKKNLPQKNDLSGPGAFLQLLPTNNSTPS